MSTWKDKLFDTLRKVEPYTQAAERIVNIGAQLNKLTPVTMLGVVSTGINSALDWHRGNYPPCKYVALPVSDAIVDAALRSVGAVVGKTEDAGTPVTSYSIGAQTLILYPTGNLRHDLEDTGFPVWMKAALNKVLPISYRLDYCANGIEEVPFEFPAFETTQGREITEYTLPLLGEGRCILLDGRPGVGKTTIAQEIARRANLGRTIQIASNCFKEEDHRRDTQREDLELHLLGYLSAGVIIVDDIDKIAMTLDIIETLRKAAKLVIFTANNGSCDEVLDGAMIRPDRIDEVFTIKETRARAEPFDQLSDLVWEEVKNWPVAYQNELAARIRSRGPDLETLRYTDLKERISRKTRSREGLYDTPE